MENSVKKRRSPETVAKFVAARRARGYWHSPETIEKIRIANKNRVLSEASKESFKQKMRGRIPWNKGTSQRTREHLNENARNWVNKNKERRRLQGRKSFLMKTFGISMEDFDLMAAKQNYKCAICQMVPEIKIDSRGRTIETLCIDHDHKTGKMRALLCRPCNSALGLFKDNTITVKNAVQYLEDYAA